MLIKKGQIIAISSGEYSDYEVKDYVRSLVDFDTANEVNGYISIYGNEIDDDYDNEKDCWFDAQDKFIALLIRAKYIEPLEASEIVEWHLGSYGKLRSSIYRGEK